MWTHFQGPSPSSTAWSTPYRSGIICLAMSLSPGIQSSIDTYSSQPQFMDLETDDASIATLLAYQPVTILSHTPRVVKFWKVENMKQCLDLIKSQMEVWQVATSLWFDRIKFSNLLSKRKESPRNTGMKSMKYSTPNVEPRMSCANTANGSESIQATISTSQRAGWNDTSMGAEGIKLRMRSTHHQPPAASFRPYESQWTMNN